MTDNHGVIYVGTFQNWRSSLPKRRMPSITFSFKPDEAEIREVDGDVYKNLAELLGSKSCDQW